MMNIRPVSAYLASGLVFGLVISVLADSSDARFLALSGDGARPGARAEPHRVKHVETDNVERIEQKKTLSHLYYLTFAINAYKEIYGENPGNIARLYKNEEFLIDPDGTKEMMYDGWGREFYYYSSESKYLLISFGSNGMPDRQVEGLDSYSDLGDQNADIVFLNGHWIQSPIGLDRFDH